MVISKLLRSDRLRLVRLEEVPLRLQPAKMLLDGRPELQGRRLLGTPVVLPVSLTFGHRSDRTRPEE